MPPLPQNTGTAAPSGLDPQLVNLAKAIRQTESNGNFQAAGKSGEYGAYQFMPSTWAETAPKFGVNAPLTQATPEQQNEVAYKQLAEWKTQHPDWNIGNFASAWNAGAGKPNAYLEGNAGTNSYGAQYDTAKYAKDVATAYQGFKAQTVGGTEPSTDSTVGAASEVPSLGGFAQNIVSSGAGLLAGVGEAVLHPIQTVQNIGGAAVGGLEKAAGQETENTQKFDNVVNFFKDRYGSLDQFEKTLYHDPVGVAADLSTVLGGAGLGAKLAGVGAKAAKAGEAANVLSKTGEALGTLSDYTNPLVPITAGVGKLVNPLKEGGIALAGKLAGLEPGTTEVARTGSLDPLTIANTTREAVGTEVASALKKRLSSLDESGKEYNAVRELEKTGKSFSSETLIPVEHNFIEEQLRKEGGMEVKDGKIVTNSGSQIRGASEVSKLQHVFDIYKPAFQKGVITPNEFLNFRSDLAKVAYNDLGKKDSDVARITDNIRRNFNDSYRDQIAGLKQLDTNFSKESGELKLLQKGLLDREGKLTDNAFNLIANAGNKGNEARLARLEKLVPGITKKLTLLKAVEDMQKALGNKVGTYGRSILEGGGIVGGLATGQIGVVAAGFAAGIITNPSIAVKIINIADQIDPKIAQQVLLRVARYATITSDLSNATQTEQQSALPGESGLPLQSSGSSESSSTPTNSQPPQSQQDTGESLDDLAKTHNFDLTAARDAGHTDQEIQAYLASLS